MNAITVNRQTLSHPDLIGNPADEICAFLETLMDAEFERGEETDFDFIDECAAAINAIRTDADIAAVLPVISRRDFMKKILGGSGIKITAAVCAALLLIIGANTIIDKTANYNIIYEASRQLAGLFRQENTEIVTSSTTQA